MSGPMEECVRKILGDGWRLSWTDSRALLCERDVEACWRDGPEVVEVTFELLSRLSRACGTRLIDVGTSVEAGFPGSEVTGAESDEVKAKILVRWA